LGWNFSTLKHLYGRQRRGGGKKRIANYQNNEDGKKRKVKTTGIAYRVLGGKKLAKNSSVHKIGPALIAADEGDKKGNCIPRGKKVNRGPNVMKRNKFREPRGTRIAEKVGFEGPTRRFSHGYCLGHSAK